MSLTRIAMKDLRDTSRSRMLGVVVVLYVLFTAGVAYIYTLIPEIGPGTGELSLELISFLGTPIGLFVPIIGLMLGFNAISGELESGSIKLLLSEPHKRSDVVFGKFVGRFVVMTIATLLGFIAALGIVLALYAELSPVVYVEYVLLTVLFGGVYVSLGIAVSSLTRSKTKATAGVVGLFVVLNWGWGLIGIGLHWIIEGTPFSMGAQPDWYQLFSQASPGGAFSRVSTAMLDLQGPAQQFAVTADDPWFLQWYVAVVVLFVWMIVPLAIGYLRFQSMDI
ncbi:ABC transporter permease subunit [Halocatena halophila]|uniref:ABC transporter permease subunit n=1 Tax=Halocatena halophila TaxID=2814576 RepID=UPI002ED3E164